MNNKSNNIGFDLSKFTKIEDIIFLDEPILTHFKRNEKHFLQYLVDTIDDKDIYLFLEVEEIDIFEYLTKKKTLKDIISLNNNICYIFEQDFSGIITDIKLIQSEYIDESFLPNTNSYLEYTPSESSFYYEFIKEYESKLYLNSLRAKAFYLKFVPLNKKYSDTIGLNELANSLLSNLSLSFKNFLKADFFNSFKEINTNSLELNKIYNILLPDLDFRMVDLKYGSFEVGLAVDSLMKSSIEDNQIKEWAINVGDKYKEIVLDDSYETNTVNLILEKFCEEDRKKIFNPIFKITENPNFNLLIKNSLKSKYTTIKVKDKSIIEKIAPKKSNIESSSIEKDYQIINLTAVIDKKNYNKTLKLENSLFNSSNDSVYTLTNNDFKKYNYKLNENLTITVKIKAEKDNIILSAEYDNNEFIVINNNEKIEEGLKKIINKIYEYIVNKELH